MSFNESPLLILMGSGRRENIVLKLCAMEYKILAVATPEKVTPKLRKSIQRISAAGLNVISCKKATLRKTLQEFAGSILLSIGFPYLLPEEVLKMFKICLNVHPTLLLRYRGPTSGAYIIINNECETGSTVHLIDAGMDTGPIVLQRKVEISRFDTICSMQRKVYSLEPDLVVEALRLLETPGFKPMPQDETQATIFPKWRKPEDSEIDPKKSLNELFDFIRACDPDEFPAFFFINGQKVCIRMWRPERSPDEEADMLLNRIIREIGLHYYLQSYRAGISKVRRGVAQMAKWAIRNLDHVKKSRALFYENLSSCIQCCISNFCDGSRLAGY